MKRILKYFILLLISLITTNVYASDIIDKSGGSSGSVGSVGSGQWIPQAVGIKVNVVDRGGNLKKPAVIFLNGHGKSNYMFSADLNPKMKQSSSISWVNGSSVSTHSLSFLPPKWTTASGVINNLYDILTKNDYKNLRDLAETHFKYEFVEDGDYLIIEPMTVIGGKYGTAFELANYYGLTSNCNDSSSFCWNYSGVVFRGSTNRPNAGVFYNTLYVTSNVLGLTTYSNSNYQDRSNCLMSNTCGRGIGVFVYRDVFECTEDCDQEQEELEEPTSAAEVGCLTAQIHDENYDNGCTVSVNLRNNINNSSEIAPYTFFARSGRFLIRKKSNSKIYINNSSYNEFEVTNSNYIATAVLNISCRKRSTTTSYISKSIPPSIKIYFDGREQVIGETLREEKRNAKDHGKGYNEEIGLQSEDTTYYYNIGSKWHEESYRCNPHNCHCIARKGGGYYCDTCYDICYKDVFDYYYMNYNAKYTYNFKYNLPTIYMNKLTGEYSDTRPTGISGVDYQTLVGIIKDFNSPSEGTIDFKFVYDGEIKTPSAANSCKYETRQEVVTFNTPDPSVPTSGDPGELQLEFRTVDPNNPFNRETNSNWCGNDCSPNNTTVRDSILNRPNSYGKVSGGTTSPIYTIELNADNIRYIKDYNQEHEYDQNDMTEVDNFLTDMRNRRILN